MGLLSDAGIRIDRGNPRHLAELSETPILLKQGVQLRDLQDYFTYVVVPSRTESHIDDLYFVSETHVKAITVIDNQRYILYDLRFENGAWKIGM